MKFGRAFFWLVFVALPVGAAGLYYFSYAAPIYQVESVFTIRSQDRNPTPQGGIFGALAAVGGFGRAQDESFSVVEYIRSLNAMHALDGKMSLQRSYGAPRGDWLSQLPSHLDEDELHRYYNDMVRARFDEISGLVTLDVRAFTAEDALQFSEDLLAQSEALVNEFNERALQDSLRLSRKEVEETRQDLEDAERKLAEFRRANRIIDPREIIARVNQIVLELESEVAKIEAEINQLSSITQADNLQKRDLERRLAVLRDQIQRESERLTGGEGSSVVDIMPPYDLLFLDRETANQAYLTALQGLQEALTSARQQQLYVVRVVAPRLRVDAGLPRPWERIGFVFLAAVLGSLILRLFYLGIRDHVL